MNKNKANILFCYILGLFFLGMSLVDYLKGNEEGVIHLVPLMCILTVFILEAIDEIND